MQIHSEIDLPTRKTRRKLSADSGKSAVNAGANLEPCHLHLIDFSNGKAQITASSSNFEYTEIKTHLDNVSVKWEIHSSGRAREREWEIILISVK